MRTEEQKRKSREQSRRWRAANRERDKELGRRYYHRHREEILARVAARRALKPEETIEKRRERYLRRRDSVKSPYHGLTRPEVRRLLEQQGMKCGLCRGDTKRFWHGDHDHDTGAFRAVLCHACNTGLGFFRDNPDLLRRAADYVESHKAKYLFS